MGLWVDSLVSLDAASWSTTRKPTGYHLFYILGETLRYYESLL